MAIMAIMCERRYETMANLASEFSVDRRTIRRDIEILKDGINVPTEKRLRAAIRAVLLDHKLYDLRTTFYTRCTECGVAEAVMKEFVGHSLGQLGNACTDLSDEYLLQEGAKLLY